MPKTKVFVSFDFDRDKTLLDFIIEQSKKPDSPFEISDHSLKKADPDSEWLERATRAISGADVFIIMLGSRTRFASDVRKELSVAIEKEKRYFQIIGYSNGSADWAVPKGGQIYMWNWENLKNLL
jgi:hypothetical protein